MDLLEKLVRFYWNRLFLDIEIEISENCERKEGNPIKELASKLHDKKEDVLGKINELDLKNISISKHNESLKNSITKGGKVFETSKCEGMH